MKAALITLLAVFAMACTTSQEIRRPGDGKEYLISCEAGISWDMYFETADELCPGGYETLSKKGRSKSKKKELRIFCPSSDES